MMKNEQPEITTNTIAETENFMVWLVEEPDGEVTYHIELNNLTIHFFREEWEEFMKLVRALE